MDSLFRIESALLDWESSVLARFDKLPKRLKSVTNFEAPTAEKLAVWSLRRVFYYVFVVIFLCVVLLLQTNRSVKNLLCKLFLLALFVTLFLLLDKFERLARLYLLFDFCHRVYVA